MRSGLEEFDGVYFILSAVYVIVFIIIAIVGQSYIRDSTKRNRLQLLKTLAVTAVAVTEQLLANKEEGDVKLNFAIIKLEFLLRQFDVRIETNRDLLILLIEEAVQKLDE